MIHYTVVWWTHAEAALTQLWLDSANRQMIGKAADEIDRLLSTGAPTVGQEGHEGFRILVVEPLLVQFSVDDKGRIVTVWSVRLAQN